jgi:hypothetical protein
MTASKKILLRKQQLQLLMMHQTLALAVQIQQGLLQTHQN